MKRIIEGALATLAVLGFAAEPADAQRSSSMGGRSSSVSSASRVSAANAGRIAAASGNAARAAAASRAVTAQANAQRSAGMQASYRRAAGAGHAGQGYTARRAANDNHTLGFLPFYYVALFSTMHGTKTDAKSTPMPVAVSNTSCLHVRFAAEGWDTAPLKGGNEALKAKITALNVEFKTNAAEFKAEKPVGEKRLLAAGLSCNLAR